MKFFQKSLIAAAVVVASAASFAAEIGTTNLLFPYVSSGSSAYTFLTINNGGPANLGGAMHFSYGMKANTAANATGCEHSNGNGTLTPNDVTQFEMSNKLNLATELANGDTNGGFPWTGGADKQGFLIVNSTGAGLSGDTLYGSAVVIDTASGLRLAYSTQGLNTTAAANADFSINNTGVVGGPETASSLGATGGLTGNANHMVTWFASPTVTAGWYVVPLGFESAMTPSGSIGGITASYTMVNSAASLGGAYDMKEAFTSGSQPASVRCAGIVTRADMLQSGALANSNKGGMALLTTTSPIVAADKTVADKSLVYSAQTTAALGGSSTFVNRVTHR